MTKLDKKTFDIENTNRYVENVWRWWVVLTTKLPTKKKVAQILTEIDIDHKKSKHRTELDIDIKYISTGDDEEYETDESDHWESSPDEKKKKKKPKDYQTHKRDKRKQRLRKTTKLLRRNLWLKILSTTRPKKVDDVKTPEQANHFTMYDGTVAKLKMNHGDQEGAYHDERSCHSAKGNYRFRIGIITPMMTDK